MQYNNQVTCWKYTAYKEGSSGSITTSGSVTTESEDKARDLIRQELGSDYHKYYKIELKRGIAHVPLEDWQEALIDGR